MRIMLCDVCQSAIKEGEKPFAFGVATDHPSYAKPEPKGSLTWTTGEEPDRNPFSIPQNPFKFYKHWEMCAACGIKLMQALERAVQTGQKELDEFKKIVS